MKQLLNCFSYAKKHGVTTAADYSIGKGDESGREHGILHVQTDELLFCQAMVRAKPDNRRTRDVRIIEALQDMGAVNVY